MALGCINKQDKGCSVILEWLGCSMIPQWLGCSMILGWLGCSMILGLCVVGVDCRVRKVRGACSMQTH